MSFLVSAYWYFAFVRNFVKNTVSLSCSNQVLNPVSVKSKDVHIHIVRCTVQHRMVTGVERDRQLSLLHAAMRFVHLTA
jgi:hypothetical protein